MKGKIVGLIVFILIGIGLYRFYINYPAWSEQRELEAKISQAEMEDLANEELEYVASDYANNIIESVARFNDLEGNDYYIIKGGNSVNYYLSNKEQMNAIALLEFNESRVDMTEYQMGESTETVDVDKSQKWACKTVKDVYTSDYEKLFEDEVYDEINDSWIKNRIMVNIEEETSWGLNEYGEYVYNNLFGDKMKEFYVDNELMTRAKNVQVINTYMYRNEENLYEGEKSSIKMVMECTADVTTLHAVKGFEGGYGIPLVSETNTIHVLVYGKNIAFCKCNFYLYDLKLII